MHLFGQQYGSAGKSAMLQNPDDLSLIPRKHVKV